MSPRKFELSAKGSSSKALGWREYGIGLMPITFWGTAFYFVAETLEYLHPGTIAWLRITFGLLFWAALPLNPSLKRVIDSGQSKHQLTPGDWLTFLMLGAVWLALPFTFFAVAQQNIDSSLAGMLVGGQPILAAVMASFFLHAPPSWRNTLGLCLGMTGIVMAAWPSITSGGSSAIGVLLIFGAILGYGFATNFVIPLVRKWGSYFVTLRTLGIACLLTMPWGIYGLFHSDHHIKVYGFLMILGVGATALTPFAFTILSDRVGATRASSVNFLIPLVSLYMGSFIRNEDIKGLSLIGLGIILIGIVAMSGADDRH